MLARRCTHTHTHTRARALRRCSASKFRYTTHTSVSACASVCACVVFVCVQPDNFLFLTNDEDSPLKATDFGLSIRHWPDEAKLTSRSGTPAYMAPELVMQVG